MHCHSKKYLLLLVFLISADVQSYNISIDPSVSVTETFSDNINLSDDELKEDDFVTSLNPEVTITAKSSFHESRMNYVLQKIHFINRERTDTFNSLNTDGKFEFLKDRFFTDYSIRNGQQNISNRGILSTDNLSINNNRQNVLSYSVHPYLTQRFSVYAFLQAGIEFDEIVSENNDSSSETFNIGLSSGTSFNTLLWDVNFRDQTIKGATGNEIVFRNIITDIRYLLTRKFAITGSVGYDDNEFQTSDDNSGLLWNTGFEWNPSQRTSVSAALGQRFFGTDFRANVSHKSKRIRLQLTFDQKEESTRTSLLEQQVFNLSDIFGETVINPETGLPAQLNVLIPQQTDEVLVRRKLRINASYEHKKSRFNLEIFTDQREFQVLDNTEDSYGARLTWMWRVGPTLSANTRFEFQSQDSLDGITSELTRVKFDVIRNLTREIDVSAGLSHTIRDVESAEGSYNESRAFVGLIKRF